MKEHESRLLTKGETYFFYKVVTPYNISVNVYGGRIRLMFVDSNNFLHNLDSFAVGVRKEVYWIHGRLFQKQDWEIERNRLLMLEEV